MTISLVADIVGSPTHIIAASRISNNQVAIFLSDSKMIDSFVADLKYINISYQRLYGGPMKNKPKKLILSNVPPIIPNTLLENYLTNNLQLKLALKISLLRINPSDTISGYVISYRK